MPTSSGKTWVQALLAKYFIDQGLSVTILEPNEALKTQTAEKVCGLDFGITVDTLDNYYEMPSQDFIYILDEFDHMVMKEPYKVTNDKVNGLWNFAKKNVIAFTATTSNVVERFATTLIDEPLVLNFVSSYELATGTSPV